MKSARIAVILAGGMTQQAQGLKEGQRIKVTGCLSRAGYKGDARDRLQLLAQTLQSLN